MEATEAVSNKVFKYSISRCKKEAKETRASGAWQSPPNGSREGACVHYREANELVLILAAIYRK